MSSKKARILLIDDDAGLVASTRSLLESAGYEIASANDGKSGLAQAQPCKPDLIVLDVMMKTETEGFEVSRSLQSDPALKDIPVILLTGIRKALRLPFRFEPDKEWLPVRAVLEKPVPPPRLLEEVVKALAKAPAGSGG
jgi:CheY-like chemotaxis protein